MHIVQIMSNENNEQPEINIAQLLIKHTTKSRRQSSRNITTKGRAPGRKMRPYMT